MLSEQFEVSHKSECDIDWKILGLYSILIGKGNQSKDDEGLV